MTDRHQWPTSCSVSLPMCTHEHLAALAAQGIRAIELTEGNVAGYHDFADASKKWFATAKECGVRIRSVHLPFGPFGQLDPGSADPAVRENFVTVQSELTRIAAQRGAELVVVHPSGEPYREEEREQRLECASESLTRLNEIARSAGIKLAIENLPRTCLGRDCAEMAQIGRAIPEAFFCFDANHSLRDDNLDIIRTMGKRIIALHISDYDFIDERHLFPGLGKNNWQAIMKALEEVDYSGTWNYELKDRESILPQNYRINHEKLLSGEIG